MEQLFDENGTTEKLGGTGGTVIPGFLALFINKRWNSYLGTNSHEWNGWNSTWGGRGSSPISSFSEDLMGDGGRPPQVLFHPFQARVSEPNYLFHLGNPINKAKKGAEKMTFVTLTCKECGDVFLLEAKDPKAGSTAKETTLCRHLNFQRHGETYEHHEHHNFEWEKSR